MTGYYKQQSGIALIISLIILLLLTIIMIAAVRVTSLEERMAGNLRNQNIAFQAAESALREAEASILNNAHAPQAPDNPYRVFIIDDWFLPDGTDPVCVSGLCKTSSLIPPDEIDSMVFKKAATGIDDISQEPEYIIEYMAEKCDYSNPERRFVIFRITARGWGNEGGANSLVQLQSTYQVHVRAHTFFICS
jgi:type IV pilus assembly protein PilX